MQEQKQPIQLTNQNTFNKQTTNKIAPHKITEELIVVEEVDRENYNSNYNSNVSDL